MSTDLHIPTNIELEFGVLADESANSLSRLLALKLRPTIRLDASVAVTGRLGTVRDSCEFWMDGFDERCLALVYSRAEGGLGVSTEVMAPKTAIGFALCAAVAIAVGRIGGGKVFDYGNKWTDISPVAADELEAKLRLADSRVDLKAAAEHLLRQLPISRPTA